MLTCPLKISLDLNTLVIFEWYRLAPQIRMWPCLSKYFPKNYNCIIWGSALWLLPISINCKQTDKTRIILPSLLERARHRLKKTLISFPTIFTTLCLNVMPFVATLTPYIYFPKIRNTNKMFARMCQAGAPLAWGSSNDVWSIIRLATIREFEIMSDTLDIHGICVSVILS